MIRITHFSWRFTDRAGWALRDIKVSIDAGELVAVAGPSGSGKSTLALAMAGLLVGRQAGEHEGSIVVADHDVAATPLHLIAEHVALVQQNPETHFATLTVRDEIAFAMENRCAAPETIRARSAQAMDLLGISHLAERDLASLSGGEQQRVAVASIVAANPRVIVLDEPTASLDPDASAALFRDVADLCRDTGRTVILIEHKLAQLLPLGPRLIRLDGGRIVEDQPQAGVAHLPAPATRVRTSGELIPHNRGASRHEPIVQACGLTVHLNGRTVLRDVALRLAAGESVALLGPNGGGKTTLLQTLAGLVPTSAGSVRLDGTTAPCAVSDLAREVGFVFQNADHQLAADTVLDEALFAARRLGVFNAAVELEAHALLDRAGLLERLTDHPFALSWGEKRRLNLISAVLHRPQLLLLDEPFAGQDRDNVTFMMQLIDSLVAGNGGACLLVIHDAQIVAGACDRVVFLAEGRIVLDAPTEEAFARLGKLGYGAYVSAHTNLPRCCAGQQELCHDGMERDSHRREQRIARNRSGYGPPSSDPQRRKDAQHQPTHETGSRVTYYPGRSIVHRLHPATKLAWLIGIAVAAFVSESAALPVTIIGALTALHWLAGFPPHRIPHGRLWLTFALAVVALHAVFARADQPAFDFVAGTGLETGMRTAGRLLAIILASTLFVISTEPTALAAGLMSIGLPYRWGFTLVTALRLAPLFRVEGHHVYRAQLIRGVTYDRAGPRRWWLLLRNLCLPLVVGALRTVHLLSLSMEGRSFGLYPTRTFSRSIKLTNADWLALALLVAMIAATI